MRFTKMHGAGNDYIYVDCFIQPAPERPEVLAKVLSDRRFGVGSDGLILLLPSEKSDLRMEIYNSDGSRARICGNGLRCAARYARERGIVQKDEITIATDAGPRRAALLEGGTVCVNMGVPKLKPEDIPVISGELDFIAREISLETAAVKATLLSIGNPHCVVFGRMEEFSVLASEIQRSPLFPAGVNVEFAEIAPGGEIDVRVMERGAGETFACGSGACAVLVAAVLEGRSPAAAMVRLRGGELFIEWKNDVFMTGGAEFIFDGSIDISIYEGA